MRIIKDSSHNRSLIDNQIHEWRLDSNITLLYTKYNSLETLENDYRQYKSMPIELQNDSDEMSIRITDKTNTDRYVDMLHKFNRAEQEEKEEFHYSPNYYSMDIVRRLSYLREMAHRDSKSLFAIREEYEMDLDTDELDTETSSDNIWDDGGFDYPMFTPEEIQKYSKDFNGNNRYYKTTDIQSRLWQIDYNRLWLGDFDGYKKSRCNFINTIKQHYGYLQTAIDDNDIPRISEEKQKLVDMGWNPEIIVNKKNISIASKRLKTMIQERILSKFTFYDIRGSKAITIEDNIPNSKGIYKLYLMVIEKDSKYTSIFVSNSPKFDYIIQFGFSDKLEYSSRTVIRNTYMDANVHTFIVCSTVNLFHLFESKIRQQLSSAHKDISSMNIRDYNKGGLKLFLHSVLSEIKAPNNIGIIDIYLAYTGIMKDIDISQAIKLVDILNYKYTNENSSLLEAKVTNEFPIEFTRDGDLLISKGKNINFEAEFSSTHLALTMYEKNKNITGMKYCLCKLWYLNLLLEEKIHSRSTSASEKAQLNRARAKIIQDIKKYGDIILKEDKDFDIIKTYQNSPFNNDKIRFSNDTLNHTYNWIRRILSFKKFK